MRHELHLLIVRKQTGTERQAGEKYNDQYKAYHARNAPIHWRTRANAPELLVQKFLVALIHHSRLQQFMNTSAY